MNRKLASLLLPFVFMLGAAGMARADAPPMPSGLPVPQGLGVAVHFTDEQLPGQIDFMKKAGISWVRAEIPWTHVERVKGSYDFSIFDHFVDTMHNSGIHIIMILDYANSFYDGGNSPASDAGRAAYAKYATAVVKHYAGKIDVWEIYNEPNIQFWKPEPDADDYVAMANVATTAIRQVDPHAVIVGPALAGPYQYDPFVGKLWPTYAFLDKVLASDAARQWSAITIHPYRKPPNAPESTREQIDNVRSMMRDHGLDPDKIPVIATEWGYSTFDKGADEQMQAAYAIRNYLLADIEHMPFSIWYDWQDDGKDPSNSEAHYGLIREGTLWTGDWAGRTTKPSYVATQVYATLLKGYVFNSLTEDDASIMVSHYTNGGKEAFVAWSVDNLPHTATISLPAGSWKIYPILGTTVFVKATGQAVSVPVTRMPSIILPTAADH